MNLIFQIIILIIALAINTKANPFKIGDDWNDLKVTWGVNPFDSNAFVSLPRNEQEARANGWAQEKNCSQANNGNRYILKGDRSVLLIFSKSGQIAGIASQIPKNLPFNFPSLAQQKYFDDDDNYWTISAYFMDPNKVCSSNSKQTTGDRLVFKSSKKELNVPLKESQMNSFWTKGKCYYTMGIHYWADISGPLNKDTQVENFLPIFLLFNKGNLNGFGWHFNADLTSNRYEYPHGRSTTDQGFFQETPNWLYDPSKHGRISTMHIYLDSTPQLNFC